ncbi:MAG: efflux RND transporter periplasmic adaptor subunit [Granulosicoccus sp.]
MITRLTTLLTVLLSSQTVHANQFSQPYQSMPGIDCAVNPHLVVDIASPVDGVIEEIFVKRSQEVTAGQELFQLEASVERASVELARYRARAGSGIGLSAVNVEFDELRKERVESLLDEQNVSKEIVDQTERDLQLSNWNLAQAKELAQVRKLELRKAEEQLNQKLIKAPFDGFVLDTYKNVGEFVDDQPIIQLAQLNPLVVEAIVPMEFYGTIKRGMRAEILLEVLRQKDLVAEVIAVDLIGDTASSTFGVKLSIPNPDYQIPAGLKCILKFMKPGSDQASSAEETDVSVALSEPSISILADSETSEVDDEILNAQVSVEPLAPELLSELVESKLPVESLPVLVLASASEPVISNVEEPIVDAVLLENDVTESSKIEILSDKQADTVGPKSYMVLIRQPEDDAAARELIEKLKASGIEDFQKINKGPNKRIISLGVFSKRKNADNRQQMLSGLGFDSTTRKIY